MHISWLGRTAVRIQAKPIAEDVTVIFDPYKPEEGNFPRSLTPNIAIFTEGEANSVTLSADPFVLAFPGECETKGILMMGVDGTKKGQTLYRVDAEGMSMAHLGLSKEPLNATQLEVLAGVDILFVPVGHPDSYDVQAAVKMVNAIEPKVVIPMAFLSDVDPTSAPITAFLSEMGAAGIAPEKKVILKKKDLPQEEVRVVLLEKE